MHMLLILRIIMISTAQVQDRVGVVVSGHRFNSLDSCYKGNPCSQSVSSNLSFFPDLHVHVSICKYTQVEV